MIYETLGDFREKKIMLILKCFNQENFKYEALDAIAKEAEIIHKKFIEVNKISLYDEDREDYKICIGFVSGAMIYIMSIKEIQLDNNL